MTRVNDTTLITATRLIALEASANAGRLQAALRNLADADGYLGARTIDSNTSGGTISDPTARLGAELADGRSPKDLATQDRRRTEHLIRRMLDDSRQLSGLLAVWNPNEADQRRARGIANNDIWCTNHLRHGFEEPRADGRTLCDFCQDYRQRDDNPRHALPGRWILDTRTRRRINSADVTNDLRLQREARQTTKAELNPQDA